MTSGKEPTVRIENLWVRFLEKIVLKDITLSLWPSQLTVLVGPSGSGKSTLLRSINRLNAFYPDCRTEGTVRIRLHDRTIERLPGFFPAFGAEKAGGDGLPDARSSTFLHREKPCHAASGNPGTDWRRFVRAGGVGAPGSLSVE